MTERYCESCHHELTNGRCWRLTCPTNGARKSAELARPGPYFRAGKLL